MERILVSSCLLGSPVRYDGAAKPVHATIVDRWRAEGRLVPFCPEVAGGLTVPREPAELTGPAAAVLDGAARILTGSGADVTGEFVHGAHRALEAARRSGARMAILKEDSPSCATTRVYDGSFTGTRVPGTGVTTALLERHGIRVFPETALDAAAAHLMTLESA